MKQLKKTLLTLVALLAVTTGAWADETPLVTINSTGYTTFTSGSKTFDDKVTVTFSNSVSNDGDHWGWYADDTASLLTVAGINGYTITSCKFYTFDGTAKTGYTVAGESPSVYLNNDYVYTDDSKSENIGKFGISKIEVYGGVASADASGPEVAWNKAENSGSFTMPGGNVTLQPEYYPQAALTAAPTAINDVPATTDGAIVEAGTVKNIGETTTAQGTVMYYVSPSALDDAALLALAADQWTADVPTAAGLAQGQAYVYYYVRGNDGDNDAENFSDGDILAANKLTVTIAAEPTYAVTFAEGTDPNEWTASPNAGVKKGETVTVTYTGSKKVIGVKAEKAKAAESLIVNPEVGQVIGSDGKNYDANATLPDGVTKVAKIFYVGSDNGEAAPYNHGLALALEDVTDKTWCSQKDATCLGTQYDNSTNLNDLSGIANTDALVNHTGHTHAAASAARNYNSGIHPAGTSVWFLPSAGQWNKMLTAAGSYANLRTNAGLQEYNGYWLSTENSAVRAWDFFPYNGGGYYNELKDNGRIVRACLAF